MTKNGSILSWGKSFSLF